MSRHHRENRDCLLIGESNTIDSGILEVLLDNSGLRVTAARTPSAVTKHVEEKPYSCIVLIEPQADGTPADRIRSAAGSVIAVYDAIETTLPEWMVRRRDVHVLHYERNGASAVVDQIRWIVDDAESATHRERDARLRDAIGRIRTTFPRVTSRTELEERVCDELFETGLYNAVWTTHAVADSLEPRHAAGIDPRHLESGSIDRLPSNGVRVTDDGTIEIPIRTADPMTGSVVLTTSRRIDTVERDRLRRLGSDLSAVLKRLDVVESVGSDGAPVYVRSVSHELRNLLQLAKAEFRAADDERLSRLVDRIEHVERAARLLARDSLPSDRYTTCDLEELVGDVRSRMDELDNRVSVRESCRIEACRPLVELLLDNLFRNTREHAGGDATISVGSTADGFYVEDTGNGFADDSARNRLEGRTERAEADGTGLGIVRRVADLHGWEIDCEESDEGGARIEFSVA